MFGRLRMRERAPSGLGAWGETAKGLAGAALRRAPVLEALHGERGNGEAGLLGGGFDSSLEAHGHAHVDRGGGLNVSGVASGGSGS
jgi:hypothetical protein